VSWFLSPMTIIIKLNWSLKKVLQYSKFATPLDWNVLISVKG
jgi:hypothetical protein